MSKSQFSEEPLPPTISFEGRVYQEVIAQYYADAVISAGTVGGDAEDTCYLRFCRPPRFPSEDGVDCWVRMRPDEMASVAWVASGILHALLSEPLPEAPA